MQESFARLAEEHAALVHRHARLEQSAHHTHTLLDQAQKQVQYLENARDELTDQVDKMERGVNRRTSPGTPPDVELEEMGAGEEGRRAMRKVVARDAGGAGRLGAAPPPLPPPPPSERQEAGRGGAGGREGGGVWDDSYFMRLIEEEAAQRMQDGVGTMNDVYFMELVVAAAPPVPQEA